MRKLNVPEIFINLFVSNNCRNFLNAITGFKILVENKY